MFSTVIKHMFWMHYVKQLEAHACFSIDRKMPILILFSQPCQSSPLARSSSCSCIRSQSIWSLPIKFPFVYAGYKTGTSLAFLARFLCAPSCPLPCYTQTPTRVTPAHQLSLLHLQQCAQTHHVPGRSGLTGPGQLYLQGQGGLSPPKLDRGLPW